MRPFESRPASSLGLTEVLYEKADRIARVTLDRPQRYNAYSTRALEELTRALRDAAFDDAVGVIVLTGAGDRAFCTGGDVREYAEEYVMPAGRTRPCSRLSRRCWARPAPPLRSCAASTPTFTPRRSGSAARCAS